MQLAVLRRSGTATEYFYMKIILLMDILGLPWTYLDAQMVEAAGIEPRPEIQSDARARRAVRR